MDPAFGQETAASIHGQLKALLVRPKSVTDCPGELNNTVRVKLLDTAPRSFCEASRVCNRHRSLIPDPENSILPESHGRQAFTFTTDEPQSYVTVRDELVQVQAGQVTRVKRATSGQNREWRVTIAPAGAGDVAITVRDATAIVPNAPAADPDPEDLPVVTIGVDQTDEEPLLAGVMIFRVLLSEPAGEGGAHVTYAVSDGTATLDEDYSVVPITLYFSPGHTSKQIGIVTLGDDDDTEGDETFTVTLTGAIGAQLGDRLTATGTITELEELETAEQHGLPESVPSHRITHPDHDKYLFQFRQTKNCLLGSACAGTIPGKQNPAWIHNGAKFEFYTPSGERDGGTFTGIGIKQTPKQLWLRLSWDWPKYYTTSDLVFGLDADGEPALVLKLADATKTIFDVNDTGFGGETVYTWSNFTETWGRQDHRPDLAIQGPRPAPENGGRGHPPREPVQVRAPLDRGVLGSAEVAGLALRLWLVGVPHHRLRYSVRGVRRPGEAHMEPAAGAVAGHDCPYPSLFGRLPRRVPGARGSLQQGWRAGERPTVGDEVRSDRCGEYALRAYLVRHSERAVHPSG